MVLLEGKVLQCKRIVRWGLLPPGAAAQQAPVAALEALAQHMEMAAAAVPQALQPQPVLVVLARFLVVLALVVVVV